MAADSGSVLDLRISVVIPTLNEAACLPALLADLREVEVIVADGGSVDATCSLAHGATVIQAPLGRGSQLAAGARAASGDVLWFLHADTRVPADATVAIRRALADPAVGAGNFALRFDGDSRGARWLTWLYPRLGSFGLCYGDSGIFVRRSVYEQIGGFAAYPIFEDLDLVRRLRQVTRFVHLSPELLTSSRRFEAAGFERQFAKWCLLQLLYWVGVSPERLGRWYR